MCVCGLYLTCRKSLNIRQRCSSVKGRILLCLVSLISHRDKHRRRCFSALLGQHVVLYRVET